MHNASSLKAELTLSSHAPKSKPLPVAMVQALFATIGFKSIRKNLSIYQLLGSLYCSGATQATTECVSLGHWNSLLQPGIIHSL